MFGDAQLNDLQMRKASVLVECASDRLQLREELLRAGSGFDRLRSPFGWLEALRGMWGGRGSSEGQSAPMGWDMGSAIQSGLKAYAIYRSVRAFFKRRREAKSGAKSKS